MFECDKCGCCCRHLDMSPLYAELDSGNGVCRYLDGNLCSIYENRPLLCRIDECYEKFFSDKISLEEYYSLNRQICEMLKRKDD